MICLEEALLGVVLPVHLPAAVLDELAASLSPETLSDCQALAEDTPVAIHGESRVSVEVALAAGCCKITVGARREPSAAARPMSQVV